MKIGYDAKRFFHNRSGLGNYSRDLIRVLAHFHADNEYLLLAKNTSERGHDILNLPNVEYRKITKGKWARQLKMGQDAQESHCEIFHGLSGELPLKWNSQPIKKVVSIHDLIFLKYPEFYSFFDRKIHTWKFKKATEMADIVIAISEQTKQDLIQHFGTPSEKIKVIYQTCHAAFKEEIPEEILQQTRESLQLPSQFLLSVGTIEKRKNLLSVVKAIKGTDIPLVVVGRETSYAKKIRRYIAQHQMDKQVFFLKNIDMPTLAHLYRLATIFIYPSLYEGFGIPVIEALFSKTLAITSNRSSLPEAGGPHSVYVNPESIEDIRAKILNLWSNPEERRFREEKSFEFVQKFREEQIAADMMEVYQSLV